MDSQGREDAWQGGIQQTGCTRLLADQSVPHSCVDKSGGTAGEQDISHNPGFRAKKIKSQNF